MRWLQGVMMSVFGVGRFEDPIAERRYQETARWYRLPFVRLYGVMLMVVALAYTIVNPLFVSPDDMASLAILFGVMLLICGAYICASFWDGYLSRPQIDFTALLMLIFLLGRVNLILFDELISLEQEMHAVGVMNRLAVSAFAAVVMAGRPKLFLLWLGLDLAMFMATVLPVQSHGAGLYYAILSYCSGGAIMVAINLAIERTSRAAFSLAEALETERRHNEELLYNMLPSGAVERIRGGHVVADSYADASVVFIDMAGFTALTKRMSPGHLVDVLNCFFQHADACATTHGVEKVKTIGDGYLAIAGGNVATKNSADAAIAFARDVLTIVPELRRTAGTDLGLRIGIHSGPVVGGVIGASRMAYDYWGETVNMASRLESCANINGIAISESCWLRATCRAEFGPAQTELLKGVGESCVFRTKPAPESGAEPVSLTAGKLEEVA
jgi:adenylate cyclase